MQSVKSKANMFILSPCFYHFADKNTQISQIIIYKNIFLYQKGENRQQICIILVIFAMKFLAQALSHNERHRNMDKAKIYKITRKLLTAAGILLITFWMLIILLYLPPVQQFAVDTICEEVSKSSGYDVKIGSVHLAFPIKLKIGDLTVSRNDTLYIKSDKAGLNISLLPLLKGEIELNYIALEDLKIDTKDLLPDISIKGKAGHFRTAARNIDLYNETANIRQLYLNGAHLDIILSDSTEVQEGEEEKSTTPGWVINLHKGAIADCSLNISMPDDTVSAGIKIERIGIEKVHANLKEGTYRVNELNLCNSSLAYDKGTLSRNEAPLDHIELKDINFSCRNIELTPEFAQADIGSLTLTQPQGISITEAAATLYCDHTSLELIQMGLKSLNGSSLDASGSIPWLALEHGKEPELAATLAIGIDKRDLSALLTNEQYDAMSLFKDNMLNLFVKVNGNVSHMEIDTLSLVVPELATLHADGHLGNITSTDSIAASINIYGHADDIRRLITLENHGDSSAITESQAAVYMPGDSGRIDIKGTLEYKANIAKTDFIINAAGGEADTKITYDISRDAYIADIAATGLDITRIAPSVPLKNLSIGLTADGRGFDIFSDSTEYNLSLAIDSLSYNGIAFGNTIIHANQSNRLSSIRIDSNDPNLKLKINSDTRLHADDINNRTKAEINRIDFGGLHLTEANLGTSLNIDLTVNTDLAEKHAVKLKGNDINIITEQKTFAPEDIIIDLYTSPDSTHLKAHNGDFNVTGNMDCGYIRLSESIDKVSEMFLKALRQDDMLHYLQDYQRLLPKLDISFSCGQNNMLANYLAMNDIAANSMRANINMDTISGLNIRGGVYGLKSGELHLDTIRMFTRQEGDKIRYFAGVRSTSTDPQNEKQTFNAAMYGNLNNDSLITNFIYRDKAEEIGAKLGTTTILKPNGLDISFSPDAIFLNEKFKFNKGNYINIGKGMSIKADVTLDNGKDAGMHLYTVPDTSCLYNANLELFNIELEDVTNLIPYAPDITGLLNLDMHIRYSENGMVLSADANAEELTYDNTYIGNEIIEAVYFPKGNEIHYIDIKLLHEEEEVLHLNGNYQEGDIDSGLDGEINLTRFPLSLSRVFTKDSGFNLDGFLSGHMKAIGEPNSLSTNGNIKFETVDIDAYSLGANLHMPDETARIIDNKLQFKDFSIYAHGDNPFTINGYVDFSSLTNPALSLRMNADSYELVNAERKKGSMLYGKLFLDTRAMIGGTLNSIDFYGNITVKNKSNITFVMLDAPIESDKELDGLVEFVNFNDTTVMTAEEKEIDLGNMNLNLNLAIEDGARLNADLDMERNNYVTTQGSGNLHLTYTSEAGINVTGRYAMSEGEFKLSLPVIPLKTLSISDGSEVSWSGPLLNPEIDITALERVTSSVTFDDNSTVPVPFDVGVKVSNTLENMGLSFVMSSPENPTVQEQLNALDTEGMNRYAVTMLLTGAYAGSSKSMTVGNALSSFIDAKISDIAGTAMKSVNLNVGINDATNAETGDSYKNYSFSFSKRFWNDRITLVIGGEVNSGDAPKSNSSFINNASLEWKISANSNRFLKLFYDKNYESILEGEITETGIGYVYKRKLSDLKELFIFNRHKKNSEKEQKKSGMPNAKNSDIPLTPQENKEPQKEKEQE